MPYSLRSKKARMFLLQKLSHSHTSIHASFYLRILEPCLTMVCMYSTRNVRVPTIKSIFHFSTTTDKVLPFKNKSMRKYKRCRLGLSCRWHEIKQISTRSHTLSRENIDGFCEFGRSLRATNTCTLRSIQSVRRILTSSK